MLCVWGGAPLLVHGCTFCVLYVLGVSWFAAAGSYASVRMLYAELDVHCLSDYSLGAQSLVWGG